MQTCDTKPPRHLFKCLLPTGCKANQQVTFLTAGGDNMHDLPRYLRPHGEHLLDRFHITMHLTVVTTMAKSRLPPPPDPDLKLPAEPVARVGVDLQR